MPRIIKCQVCKTNEAIYAQQYVGDDAPQYYTLGFHLRGFPLVKICAECTQKERSQRQKPSEYSSAYDGGG